MGYLILYSHLGNKEFHIFIADRLNYIKNDFVFLMALGYSWTFASQGIVIVALDVFVSSCKILSIDI